jgi:hypothetical protein
MPRLPVIAVLASLLVLSGCDLLGIEGATAIAARKEAEGKAIGAACRNAARAIEDCYTLNKKADKAAVYAGWREMDDYMRENKLEPVPPQLTPDVAKPKASDEDEESAVAEDDSAKDGTKQAKASSRKPASH